MRLDKLPIWQPEGSSTSGHEDEPYAAYQTALSTVEIYRRLYLSLDELPDILVEARAFAIGVINHEDGEPGWCVWEFMNPDGDPENVPRIRRFLERLGYNALAKEVRAVEIELATFDPADVIEFFAGNQMSEERHTPILEVMEKRFEHPEFHQRFGETIWEQVARDGAKLIEDTSPYCPHSTMDGLKKAQRSIVDALPGYETREQQNTMWRSDQPFHRLLLNVGERYFHDDCLKVTRSDGTVVLHYGAEPYQELTVFKEASRVSILTSTKGDWLCCHIGDRSWLVDPKTGNKLVSTKLGEQ
ncbi:hypothetical protein [Leisingera aquaemixtae]|nr:hypothetical protein [Leisingera aquaemixtae]